MKKEGGLGQVLHLLLRPAFALALFGSQFTSQRGSLFSANPFLLALGGATILGGLWLWAAASIHLRRADGVAKSGPFRQVRHPIYVSIYLLSIGLGLLFFAWAWFLVLALFAPLWWIEAEREEQGMLARHGAAYRAYQARTKRFIPYVL